MGRPPRCRRRGDRSRWVRALVAVLALSSTACAGTSPNSSAEPADPSPSQSPTSSTTTIPATTTTTEPPCPPVPPDGEAAPPRLTASLAEGLLRLVSSAPQSQFTVSIRVDGYGEVLAHEPDLPLSPASNQKLFSAYGALSVLDLFGGLATTVTATVAPDAAGMIDGDLALVAAGDPTLTTRGPHSLAALADLVSAAGITEVRGRLLIDDTRYEAVLIPPGWPDFQVPQFGGPLSALMVDDNEGRRDAAFLADPDLEHTRTFAALLSDRGVAIGGPIERGSLPLDSGVEVGSIASEPVGALIGDMLRNSDNETADLLLREVGRVASGFGSLAAGAEVTQRLFAESCLDLDGGFGDGSGVSLDNLRSARDLRRMIDLFLVDPLGAAVLDSLPVAARSGTLVGRFGGTSASGVLRAKSGSIIGGKAITGLTRTADGRTATFSIVVNGADAAESTAAMDALLVRISNPA